MKVIEIFDSIEGEGKRTGELTTFIRLAGCNLRCSYCDTPYSYCTNAPEKSIAEIINSVGYRNVTITGGEPLAHAGIGDLINEIMKTNLNVNIETNGSIGIDTFRPFTSPHIGSSVVDHQLFFTVDYKLPSSGMEDKMFMPNLTALRPWDVLKFVAGSAEDLERMLDIHRSHNIAAKQYVSPVFGKIEPVEIVDFLKANKLKDIALQLQMHKLVWPPEMRGV